MVADLPLVHGYEVIYFSKLHTIANQVVTTSKLSTQQSSCSNH